MSTSRLDELRIEREPESNSTARRGPGWLLMVLLLVVLATASWWYVGRSHVIEVSTSPVARINAQAASTVLNASGYVTARRQATVSSEMTGKVTEVLIEEGMVVEEGQVLARIDDANIRAAYELARAQRDAAQSALAETEALLREARSSLERTRSLVDRQLASPSELDKAVALADSLEARLATRHADIEVAERNLGVWEEQLADTIIRAPFAGVVVAKNAQPGEMISPVSAGGGFTRTGIGTIVDMGSLEIEIDVNEAYINRVSAGQKVVATLDAYPDWSIPCTVIAIIPTADRQRATVEVRVGFDELDPRILPDMGVKVAFQESSGPAGETLSRVAVPEQAVRQADGRHVVFVVVGERVERRAVAVAERREGRVFIESGLSPGERVVTAGPADLADGATVKERQQ
jgi:RND family efflux transporter MFP subunit